MNKENIKTSIENYKKSVFLNKRSRYYLMQKLLPNDIDTKSIILDYGCGTGIVASFFSNKFNFKVDAVDHSEEELIKARIAFADDKNINFLNINQFKFPQNNYNLVFSCSTIEHIHNPGNYLSKINKMLKKNAYLLIGLPNIVNLNHLINLIFFSQKRAVRRSKKILSNYKKPIHHINGWDPHIFSTLLGSCGFEVEKYMPMEGTPIFNQFWRIPFIGKYLTSLPFNTTLSYTMFFLAKKSKDIEIANSD